MKTPINDSITEYLEYLICNNEIVAPVIAMNMKKYKKLEKEQNRLYGCNRPIEYIHRFYGDIPLIIDNELPKNINYCILDYFRRK